MSGTAQSRWRAWLHVPRAGAVRQWALAYPSPDLVAWRTELDRSAPSEEPSVTVAIPHWRAPDWCFDTAASFIRQEGVQVRVVVIDNSPDVGLRAPAGVEIRPEPRNVGFAAAVNQVLDEWVEASPGPNEFFVMASHDCVIQDGVLSDLITALRELPQVGIVGPLRRVPLDVPGPLEVDGCVWVTGACLAIRPECAADLGGLDEALGTYDEDLDYCLRAWDGGWAVGQVATGGVSTHGSAAGDVYRRVARNHVVLGRKRRGVSGALVEMLLQFRRAVICAAQSLLIGGRRGRQLRAESLQRAQGAALGFTRGPART